MNVPGRDKDEGTLFYRVPLSPIKELPSATSDKINLVARVRRLRVLTNGRIKLHDQ